MKVFNGKQAANDYMSAHTLAFSTPELTLMRFSFWLGDMVPDPEQKEESIPRLYTYVEEKDYAPVEIIDDEKIIKFHFQARSFLHNQVRSIVGSLEKVGSKKWLPNYIKTILDKKDRKKCGPIAPPEGLYLKKIFF